MGDSYLFRGLKPFERRLIYASVVGILICIYLLQFHNFSRGDEQKLEREIGFFTETKSDIRVKNYSQSLWQSAQKNQKVREGDKIYTGDKSSARIRLLNESKIELKENSLVEFKKIRNEDIADLAEGEYRVAVVKNLKIAIKGQIAKIEGSSEVVLKVSKNKKISIQTLQGAPKVEFQAKTYTPTQDREVEIDPWVARKIATTQSAPLEVNTELKTYDYVLKLYDVYERIGQQLRAKNDAATLVRFKVPLTIETFDNTDDIQIEYSTDSRFINARQFISDSLDRNLPEVYLGDNYWHCKQEKRSWSAIGHFQVRPILLPASEVAVHVSEKRIFLKEGMADILLSLKTSTKTNGYLVESTRKSTFDQSSSIHWSYQDDVHLRFNQAGIYHYRFRAVDENLQLGEWSETTDIEVIDAPNVPTPLLTRSEFSATKEEPLIISWLEDKSFTDKGLLAHYEVSLFDINNKKIYQKSTSSPFVSWTPAENGNYRVEVKTKDKYNRYSPTAQATMEVKPPENLHKILADEEREIASKEQDPTQIVAQYPVVQLGFNADFILSRFVFSTNYYDGFNSKVLTKTRIPPVMTPGIQANGLLWKGHHGFEGFAQKNLTSNEVSSSDFYSLQARYHYRFYDSTARPDLVGFHLSPFIGYEIYSNSKSTYFLAKYNMLKLGIFFELPVMKSWTTGLNIAYGTGNSLTQYEALWDIAYFFKRQWAMGLGLKTSVIFGTTTQFPTYKEYREGYSLGQFNLKYFF